MFGGASHPLQPADRQRLQAVIQHIKQTGLCANDVPTLTKLVDRADDELSRKYSAIHIITTAHCLSAPLTYFLTYVLRNILPNETVSSYGLRQRHHNRELADKTSRLVQSSFIDI